MASNKIKGLTIEIGGDTTKLGQALEDVTKKSNDISSELRDINKLLKLDPGNTELLSQKQKVLADAIAATAEKLDTLKEAEKQVQKQFERGEVTEEQVRALQREIIETEKQMQGYEKAIKDTTYQLKHHGKAADDAKDKTRNFGGTAKAAASAAVKGFAAVTATVTAAAGALVAIAESTREYRTEMGKLDVAFTTAGHSTEAAMATYKGLQGVLGETDQAVEAANHLAKLADSEQDLKKWTDICTGVYATFGASLPIEGLTEAANETAKVGAVTGPLADALNWAGVSEDAFNESLAACNSEQERQALIMETLGGLYDEAATKYKETNAEVIRANEANEAWAASMAEIGAEVEPLLSSVKLLGASLLTDLTPSIKGVTEAFGELIAGEDGAADKLGVMLGEMISELLAKATELIPRLIEVGVSLVTSVATAIVEQIPALVEAVADVLIKCVPQLIEGAVTLLMAIVDAIDKILPVLIEATPDIVLAIVDALMEATPQLIDGALLLLLAIVDAIPLLIEKLVPELPRIITTIANGLLNATPQILQAGFTLLSSLSKAIPQACSALLKSLPQIWTTIGGYLAKLPEKVVSIGKELVSGIWKGMTDRTDWLKDKITGWVGDVTGFLKRLFGINSPSKVTAYMGEMLDEGLAKGIDDAADVPLASASDLSTGVLNEFESPDGLAIERRISHTYSANMAASVVQSAGALSKLDAILAAIKSGQVINLDGATLVGGTADRMNSALGMKRVLAERGAI